MRNRFHSICPYFAMFPEEFVQRQLAWSNAGDLVLDPFCGRGTTLFEALLRDRDAIGCDTNEVAVCVSRAKSDPPKLSAVLTRLDELEEACQDTRRPGARSEFFRWCFHADTYRQVSFLRDTLKWKRRRDDCFIAALSLGMLHGESHKTEMCFSNRMPRTISTKPAYSVRWWRKRRCVPPNRDVFQILRGIAAYRFISERPRRRGRVVMCDARDVADKVPEARSKVRLIVTSPPYLDTTNYREDQWLRLWFLGGPPEPETGNGDLDDRHRSPETYWPFLKEAWAGVGSLLADGAHVIVRIGGRRLDRATCEAELRTSMRDGFNSRVRLLESATGPIRKRQAVAFHPAPLKGAVEHDFHFRIS